MQFRVKRHQQKLQKLHSCSYSEKKKNLGSEQMPKHQMNWELNRCYSYKGRTKPGKHM